MFRVMSWVPAGRASIRSADFFAASPDLAAGRLIAMVQRLLVSALLKRREGRWLRGRSHDQMRARDSSPRSQGGSGTALNRSQATSS